MKLDEHELKIIEVALRKHTSDLHTARQQMVGRLYPPMAELMCRDADALLARVKEERS